MSSPAESLENLFLKFARAILRRVNAWTEQDGLPTVAQLRTEFTDDGFSQHMEVSLNYWKLVKAHYGNDLWKMEEAQDCIRQHVAAGVLSRPELYDADGQLSEATFEQLRPHLIIQLLRPIVEQANECQTHELTDEQLIEAYGPFRHPPKQAPLSYEATVPLTGVKGNLQSAQLDSIEIVAFSPNLKNNIWDSSISDMLVPIHELVETRYAFVCKAEQSEPICRDRVSHAITALRLFKAGVVGASVEVVHKVSEGKRELFSWGMLSDLRAADRGPDYTLQEDDIPAICDLYNNLVGLDAKNKLMHLSVALRRFNQAYARETAEDRIIDFTISLENTLLAGVREELKYRLALRGAALLATSRETADTVQLLKHIYDARSEIVHNGKALAQIKVPPDIVTKCEEVVREVLKAYLQALISEKIPKDVNKDLEESILRGLKHDDLES